MMSLQRVRIGAALFMVAASSIALAQATNTYPWPSSGNVGIGTTSPVASLNIYTAAANGSSSAEAASALTVTNASAWGGYITNMGYTNIGISSVLNASDTSSKAAFYSFVTPTGGGTFGAGLYIDGVATGTNYGIYSPVSGLPSYFNGSVGIGTRSPSSALEVNGSVKLTAGSGAAVSFADGTSQTTAWTGVLCGGDYAEAVNASGDKKAYEPGDVLVLGDGRSGDVEKSVEPYSTTVAGIYATKPGVIGKRESLAKSTEDIPMAMVGIVPTKVSAENGPIHRGDLLVTSSTSGYAMKGTDRGRMLGAVIGKAMGSLSSGSGEIDVLVTLQ